MRSLYKEVKDMLDKVINEAWTRYFNAEKESIGTRDHLLNTVRVSICNMADRLQLAAPKLTEQWLMEQLKKVEENHEMLKMQAKVKPLA